MNNIERIIGKYHYEYLLKLDTYPRCFSLVSILFSKKCDKEGQPYLNHLSRVSFDLGNYCGMDGVVAGFLHDVVEDIDGINYDDLKEFGINDNIIDAVRLVTNEKSINKLTPEQKLKKYNDKINKIIESNNTLAIYLKYCDMKDNYNLVRLKKLDQETQKWFKLKYEKNLKKLKQATIDLEAIKIINYNKERDKQLKREYPRVKYESK